MRCPRCGSDNAEGRIFCHNCNGVLTALEGKRQRMRRQRVHSLIQSVLALLVLVVLGVAGAALWPNSTALGECGGAAHGRQAALILTSLNRGDDRVERFGRDLREADVNAYIRHLRLSELPFEALSLDLMPGRVGVRASSRLGEWTCAGYCLAPTVSRDYTLRFDGSAVFVEKASLGHLPLPGMLARKSYAWLVRRLHDTPELELLSKASTIDLQEDRVHIAVGNTNSRTAEVRTTK